MLSSSVCIIGDYDVITLSLEKVQVLNVLPK